MLPYLRARGHIVETAFLQKSLWRRWSVYRRLSEYDLVFLQKRLLSWGELRIVRQRSIRLVYDLDDAVMYDSEGNEDARRLARFQATCRAADLVICGNDYLHELAVQAGGRTTTIPTAIDTNRFCPATDKQSRETGEPLTIGWTGSRATNGYLNAVLPTIAPFAGRVRVKIISDTAAGINYSLLQDVPHQFVRWSPEIEVAETGTFDIGIMPLPDDPWSRGKCGFKALQYMALGIPAICSPVGVNREIVHDGLNGFLAGTRDEWYQAISRLVKDSELRETMGHAGRRRVEQDYALDVVAPRLVDVMEHVQSMGRKSA